MAQALLAREAMDRSVDRPGEAGRVRERSRFSGVIIGATIAAGTAFVAWLGGWANENALVLGGLMLATILASGRQLHQPATTGGVVMPLSFVSSFTTLLLFGPLAATVVAVAGAVAEWPTDSARPPSHWRALVDLTTIAAAMQVAGLVHHTLGGTPGQFVWPWHGVPIAAAVVAYCAVRIASTRVVLHRSDGDLRSCIRGAVRSCPSHVLGGTVAVGLAELVAARRWDVLAVAALPLYFAYQAHRRHQETLAADHRRREALGSLDQGIAVLDGSGRVTLWNDTLERMLACPRAHALGQQLSAAVPELQRTELPQAVENALARHHSWTTPNLAFSSDAGTRILQVSLLPDASGVTTLWHDVTERFHAEHALRRSEDRFALVAAGASDGLWEWDLRRRQIYLSGRWRALVGLPARAVVAAPHDWFERVHPDDAEALRKAIDAHLAGDSDVLHYEHRLRHEDGTYRRFLCRGLAVRGDKGRATRMAGSMTDTTERASILERLRCAGFRDPLTGLYNRAVFVEGLGRRLHDYKQRQGSRFAVLYLDLDRFKVVNDSLGHLVGDELLTAVSRRLETCLREGDALARLGGDEFAILLTGLGDEGQANGIAFRIQDALSAPFSIAGRDVFTSASIGIAFSTRDYNNPEEIMRDADTAMYHAKARGKARHEVFDADMHARAMDRLGLENDLRHAVKSQDFEVQYQPIVSLASGLCAGFEALVRWKRNGQPITPAKFIPVAEELGLIEALGTWVLQEACRTFADWQRRFPANKLECITVNVSTRQLMQPNFLQIVEQAVRDAGMQPSDLRLEITETTLMDSPYLAAEALRELRDFGVKIYLDDFGTGYSSLSHLHKLPVDALKIDRSFVRSLLLPDRPAIVESILALARTLETGVVAEGVESDVQARELARLGCTHAQGYYFSAPLSTGCAEEILVAAQPLGRRPAPYDLPGREGHGRGEEVSIASSRFEWPDDLIETPADGRRAQRRDGPVALSEAAAVGVPLDAAWRIQ